MVFGELYLLAFSDFKNVTDSYFDVVMLFKC